MALQKIVNETYYAEHIDVFRASQIIANNLDEYSVQISHQRPNEEKVHASCDWEERLLSIPSLSAYLIIEGVYYGAESRWLDFKNKRSTIEARLMYPQQTKEEDLELIRNIIKQAGLEQKTQTSSN